MRNHSSLDVHSSFSCFMSVFMFGAIVTFFSFMVPQVDLVG